MKRKTKWKPNVGERYFFVMVHKNRCFAMDHIVYTCESRNRYIRNYYKTEKEAKAVCKKIKKLLEVK